MAWIAHWAVFAKGADECQNEIALAGVTLME